MGTPDFAVASLKSLHENQITVAAVVTATDKPAGRGQKLTPSPVKEYALANNIPVLQPEKLKDDTFVETLRSYQADLFVVVAFRMLPEVIWSMPPMGTINLHASLLPQYRGAAPINWAIINGEKKTGVTTFFIEKEIDTGKIIEKSELSIGEEETAGSLHDRLMELGSSLILQTVIKIREGKADGVPQETFDVSDLKSAPKIFRDTCHINWKESQKKIFNHIRGLSPYPAAWTSFRNGDQLTDYKIYQAKKDDKTGNPGDFETDGKTFLRIFCQDGSMLIQEWQAPGKKRMNIDEYLRGTSLPHTGNFC